MYVMSYGFMAAGPLRVPVPQAAEGATEAGGTITACKRHRYFDDRVGGKQSYGIVILLKLWSIRQLQCEGVHIDLDLETQRPKHILLAYPEHDS